MEKYFKSYKDLLNFDFSKLEPEKSNYLTLIPVNGILPRLKLGSSLKNWKWVNVEYDQARTPEIFFEITPKWLTTTIIKPTGECRRRVDFELNQKDPKSIIQELFEE
jgi:hypothetical protein